MSIIKSILLKIGAILVLCMTLVGLVNIRVSVGNIRTQIERDSTTMLGHMRLQLEYMMDEVKRCAKSVAADPVVQDYLFHIKPLTDSDVMRQMKSYKVQRDYIHSVAAVSATGEVLWEEMDMEPDYFQVYLEEDWYHGGLALASPYFSSKHGLRSRSSYYIDQVISYVQPVASVEGSARGKGQVVVNVRAEYFTGALEAMVAEFDEVLVLNRWNEAILSVSKDDTARLTADDCVALSDGSHNMDQDVVMLQTLEGDMGRIAARYPMSANVSRTVLENMQVLLLSILVLLFLGIGVMIPTTIRLIKPLKLLLARMQGVTKAALPEEQRVDYFKENQLKTRDEIIQLDHQFNLMLRELDKRMQRTMQDAGRMKELEMSVLLSQINPHFLYNTLNTVIFLSKRYDAADIETIVESLISILQDSIRTDSEMLYTTMEGEMRMINCYARIQSYRYKNSFTLEWSIPESLRKQQIPRLLIQPLVENALFHGIQPKGAPGTIYIAAYREEAYMILTVTDDGVGMGEEMLVRLQTPEMWAEDEAPNARKSIGVRNIHNRLQALYGSQAELRFESGEQEGTVATLILPIQAD